MNRFKNILRDEKEPTETAIQFGFWPFDPPAAYQDLYDMLSDDYRGGYHGSRKTKLLLYIAHRAYREYGVIIHTGNGFAPLDANDTHHGDPADLAVLLDDYSYSFVEHEDVLEFLAGIR